MSGTPQTAQSTFVPAPIGGINLLSSPFNLAPTECLALDNYLTYDWGIQARYKLEASVTETYYVLERYITDAGAARIFYVKAVAAPTYVEVGSMPADTLSPQTVFTGPAFVSAVTNIISVHQFKNRIYVTGDNGINLIANPAAGTYVAMTALTGPTSLGALWDLKGRLYGIDVGAAGSLVWYTNPVGSITGAMVSVDFSSIMPGGTRILFGTSWSYNQGLSNDELMVLVSVDGDVLVYSGDYPNAANWELRWRGSIPTPITNSTGTNASFIQLGHDILVTTKRGIISLQAVIQGTGSTGDSYYVISRNIGNVNFGYEKPVIDLNQPFIYFLANGFLGSSAVRLIYVLNYERGSWSAFNSSVLANVFGISLAAGGLVSGVGNASNFLLVYGFNRANSVYIFSGSGLETGADYKWQTGYYSYTPLASGQLAADPNETLTTKINLMRPIVKTLGAGGGTVGMRGTITCDFDATGDPDSQTAAFTTYKMFEVHPSGVGTFVSLKINSDINIGTDRFELFGSGVMYERGGVY